MICQEKLSPYLAYGDFGENWHISYFWKKKKLSENCSVKVILTKAYHLFIAVNTEKL